MSIRTELRNAPQSGKPIIGHDIMSLYRFGEDTRHMVIFDVLTRECPVGAKGERIRVFLNEEGYATALASQERGETKIICHARVHKGELIYNAPERDHMSIQARLRAAPERGGEIVGHELMGLYRFMEDVRHMIVFDVLTWDCPGGDKGQRVRIFLTDEGYTKALESEERGEMKIIRHARVHRGDITYDVPERDHEEY